MGKFKDFLFSEQFGLGDLGVKTNSGMSRSWLGNAVGGAFMGSDQTGSEGSPTGHLYPGHDVWMPSTDMTLPQVQKNGRIVSLSLNTNPIYVRLSDGTDAYFTYDEWKKIKGEPAVGKAMTVIFQRNPLDRSGQHSKISYAYVN